MSSQNYNNRSNINNKTTNTNEETEQTKQQPYSSNDEVDIFLNSSNSSINNSKYVYLPKGDKEKRTYQFFNDKSKRKLITKEYIDPITKQKQPPQTKVQYTVVDPTVAEQGEKLLDVPRIVAQQIEANIVKRHTLLEITRWGLSTKTRYTVTEA